MYAVGYFLEVGIGAPSNTPEYVFCHILSNSDLLIIVISRAVEFYKRAADLGDKRAAQRLKISADSPMRQPGSPGSVLHRDRSDIMSHSSSDKSGKDKDCVIM